MSEFTSYLLYNKEKKKWINNKPKYQYMHNVLVENIKDAMHFKTIEDAKKSIKNLREDPKEYQIATCKSKVTSKRKLT